MHWCLLNNKWNKVIISLLWIITLIYNYIIQYDSTVYLGALLELFMTVLLEYVDLSHSIAFFPAVSFLDFLSKVQPEGESQVSKDPHYSCTACTILKV